MAALPLAPPASGTGTATLLIDFGDGMYSWVDVGLPDENETALKATELASAALGLPAPEVTWFDSPFCVRRPCAFVDDLGDRNPAWPAWWHLFLWNESAAEWESAPFGPSDTDLAHGDAIAWYLAVDDPVTYASPRPVARLDSRHVHTSFRGDLGNRGVTPSVIPDWVRVAWDRDLGVLEIDTTPVVAYGRVFVATRSALVALDASTGEEVWRNPDVHDLLSTPAIHDGRLILGGTDGRLRAAWASNGTVAWSVLLETGAQSTGIASSPSVHEGRAYVGTFNETAGGMGRVAAVNLNNGSVAWTYETGSVHMSAPAIADGALYVGVMGVYDGGIGYAAPHGLLSLWLNGTLRWFHATGGPVAASPLVTEDRVYVPAKDGYLYALDRDGALVWQEEIGEGTSSPAFAGDRLYVASGGFNGTGAVFALDRDGTILWEADPGGPVQASLVTDGRLVCGATNVASGSVFCLRTTDGTLAWRFTPAIPQYILGSPVVVGDVVYAPSDNGHVYALVRDAPPEAGLPVAYVALVAILVVAAIPVALFLIVRRRARRHA